MRFPILTVAIIAVACTLATISAAPASATCVGGSCSIASQRPAAAVLRGVVRGPVRVVQVIRHRERFRILPWRRCSHGGCGCE